jgi:phospholipid transport system transporter-binding protein
VSDTAEGSGSVRRLAGALDLHSVPALLESIRADMDGREALELDLSGVERCDSAGVALLIACRREAGRRDVALSFSNIPGTLRNIARFTGMDTLIDEPPPAAD